MESVPKGESSVEKVAVGVGSGLVGVHIKGSSLAGRLLTISRNWLILEWAVPPKSATTPDAKHQSAENKDWGIRMLTEQPSHVSSRCK